MLRCKNARIRSGRRLQQRGCVVAAFVGQEDDLVRLTRHVIQYLTNASD